ATITKECKQAYESLIEKPTPSMVIAQLTNDMPITSIKVLTIPMPAPRQHVGQHHSLQKQMPHQTRKIATEISTTFKKDDEDHVNMVPLPPRGSKPKLVDKPRHIRKYPLRLPTEIVEKPPVIPPPQVKAPSAIYQNTVSCSIPLSRAELKINDVHKPANNAGIDVFDGPEIKVHTNPFTTRPESIPGPSSANPFIHYLEDNLAQLSDDDSEDEESVEKDFERMSLTKDHVSVEDLLEFADQKPSARQRGVESDEVRIMNKVLKKQ
ncbi:jg27968, partial [Pararge aegeria aegeria]